MNDSPAAIALFSGGLDAALALRLIEQQGVAVEAVWVRVPCAIREARVLAAARSLNVPLTILPPADDYCDRLYAPLLSGGQAGRQAARQASRPCRDCRVGMFRAVRRYAESRGIRFAISGEVLGQNNITQRRRDLTAIAVASGWNDRLVRPLSAQVLPITLPESNGWLDRARLLDLHGASERRQHELAQAWGIDARRLASAPCALLDEAMRGHVERGLNARLLVHPGMIEVLRSGRIEWLDEQTVLVLSRRADEATQLRDLFQHHTTMPGTLLELTSLPGPTGVLLGIATSEQIEHAQRCILARVREAVGEVIWRIESRPAATP